MHFRCITCKAVIALDCLNVLNAGVARESPRRLLHDLASIESLHRSAWLHCTYPATAKELCLPDDSSVQDKFFAIQFQKEKLNICVFFCDSNTDND